MSDNTPIFGITDNDIPYAKFGSGSKTMLLWSGGPGNFVPRGMMFNQFTKGLDPLLQDYTLWLLTRRSGLTEGYSTRDMANDYAELINAEYGGHVDLIVGVSYGGIIAQHFAADHPDLCDHIVMCGAAYKVSDSGKALDYRFAELLSQNKPRQAFSLMAEPLTSGPVAAVIMRPVLWLFGPSMLGDGNNEVFRRDVLIEAQAEIDHDGRESLSRITIPILILAGENDNYFPQQFFQETVDLIPGGRLKIYPSKGHNVLDDHETANDILAWVAGALE